jgi:hypothetical protein
MPLFASAVFSVGRTRVLVAPTRDGRQLTVYETVVVPNPVVRSNALILPCLSQGGKVELLDVSKDTFSFDSLAACFPTFTPHASMGIRGASDPLPVRSVEPYSVSVSSSLADLERVVTLSAETRELLGKHYSSGYAFVVCIFDTSKDFRPHPIAYIHDRYPGSSALLVPRVREHGDGDDINARLDHEVYSLCASAVDAGETPPGALLQLTTRLTEGRVQHPRNCTSVLASSAALSLVVLGGDVTLRRRVLDGVYPNDDLPLHLESTAEAAKTVALDKAYLDSARCIQREHDDRVAIREAAERAQETSFSHRK